MDAQRWRREIAALRMLALPGMVALLDHGVWEGRPFLVMERVFGSPFPGRRGPVAWEDLAYPAATLLETLAAVHEAGFVHRDIKPSNVLVDASGRAVLLDFGLARTASSGDTMTTAGAVVGTPAYMAPEVLLGERPTAASDLYSFGCLLFEALAGWVPHRASEAGFLMARLRRPADPLPEGVAAPAEVRAWIEALLSLDPSSRPRSAREVLRGLAAPEMAWLGPDPVWEPPGPGVYPFYAPPGGGKTTWARRVAGPRAVWGYGEERPFSLARSLGIASNAATLSELQQALDAKLEELASSGRWLVLDGAAGLDERSWRAIQRTAGLVCLALTTKLDGGTPIPRLHPADLAPLFEGPDLLLHLPEDAASRLWRRSGGWPGLVVHELARWERAGLARRAGGRWRVTREDLDRLAREGAGAGLPLLRGLDAAASEVLSVLELAGELDADQLARATGRAAWEVEATLEDLQAVGGVLGDGRTWLPRASAEASRAAAVDDRPARHGAIADVLPPGAPRRWRHLALAGRTDEAGREAAIRARAVWEEGKLGEARGIVDAVLGLVLTDGSPHVALRLLELAAFLAFSTADPRSMEAVRHTLQRSGLSDPTLDTLLTGATLASRGSADAALTALDAVIAEGEREVWAWTFRATAARGLPREPANAIFAAARAWAARSGDLDNLARVDAWEGLLAYERGDNARAIDLLTRASSSKRGRTTGRLSLTLNLTNALLDAGDLDRAASTAEQARREAEAARLPLYEARAISLLRMAESRMSDPPPADPTIPDAALAFGHWAAIGPLLLTEACIAWRGDRRDLAGPWALQAARAYRTGGLTGPACLAEALALACGAPIAEAELERLRADVSVAPPGIRWQVAALVPRLVEELGPPPDGDEDRPRELFSLREVRERLGQER